MDFKVHLSRPDISQADIDAVCEVLRSPNLSLGPKLRQFEEAFEKYIGKKLTGNIPENVEQKYE